MLRCRDTEMYRSFFLLRLTIFLSLFCLLVSVSNAQTAQPTPKPSPPPTPRHPLPKLSNGARGFDTRKEKDASPRLIAVGGGWGGGGDEKEPKLKRKTAQGYYILGREYAFQLEFSKAIVALEKAVRLNPNYFAAYYALGEAYAYSGVYYSDEFEDKDKASKFEQMRYRQAIRAYAQARRLAPKSAYIHLNLGILYFNTGQYQKAADSLQQGLHLKPKPYELSNIERLDAESSLTIVYFYISRAYEYLEQSENAIKFYQQALVVSLKEKKNQVSLLDIYWNLGQLYEKLGELDKALALYQSVILERTGLTRSELDIGEGFSSIGMIDVGDVLLSIGTIYAIKQNIDEAADAFNKAVNIYEGEFNRYNQFLAEKTEAKEKKFWEEEIISLQPKLVQASYNLGVAQLSLNQTEKAIESFKRVVELDEKNADTRFNIGVAYLALGDKEAAREQARILKAVDSELAKELEELINR